MPALILLLTELALRMAGYGVPSAFFVRMADGTNLTANLRFGWRFMPRETSTAPLPLVMAEQKPADTHRIFILGESAAQGTPAPAFGFTRCLEVMLQDAFPLRRFEIVNAAMRGIDSHVILEVARDCARYAPDLLIVYMGNNESVGLHAPDKTSLSFTPPLRWLRWINAVKGTRLGQWMQSTVGAWRIGEEPKGEQDMTFFRERGLAADDPRRDRIYRYFRGNLEEICRTARAAGSPVLLGTLAVNLVDCPPLGSLHRTDLGAAEAGDWEKAWLRGKEAESSGAWSDALTNYLEAVRIDDRCAELHFRLGRVAEALGRTSLAVQHYSLARDWDTLPFRGDSRLNGIIRDVAEEYQREGVVLVDVEQQWIQTHGLSALSGRFFQEHVHLNFDGDHALAAAFLPAVARVLGLPASDIGESARSLDPASRQRCAEVLAFTEWDEIGVRSAMLRMTAKAPFLDQLEHAERQTEAEESVKRRIAAFGPADLDAAMAVYQAALRRRPEDWQLRQNYGTLLMDFGGLAGAVSEYGKAVELMPVYPALRLMLARAQWEQGKREEAKTEAREILRLAPYYRPAREALESMTGRKR